MDFATFLITLVPFAVGMAAIALIGSAKGIVTALVLICPILVWVLYIEASSPGTTFPSGGAALGVIATYLVENAFIWIPCFGAGSVVGWLQSRLRCPDDPNL